MPFGYHCEFETFEDCVRAMMRRGRSRSSAERICGALMRDTEEKCNRREGEVIEGPEAILSELRADDLTVWPSGYPYTRCADAVRQALDSSKMTVDFVMVTRKADINRNGHKVQIVPGGGGKGLLIDNYKRNPVVMFDHGLTGLPFPIAKTTKIKLSKSQAVGTAQFSQSLPEAVQIFALIEEGIINAASISFLPLKARLFRPKRDKLEEGEQDFRSDWAYDFITSDLLEWGPVSVPADPGAIRKFLERGHIHGERLTPSVRCALTRVAETPCLCIPGWTDGTDEPLRVEVQPNGEDTTTDTESPQTSGDADGQQSAASADRPADENNETDEQHADDAQLRETLLAALTEELRQLREPVAALERRQAKLEQELRRITGEIED